MRERERGKLVTAQQPLQWMQLNTRKQDMRRLFERMRDYQFEKVKEEPDKALTEDTRVLTDEDIMRCVIQCVPSSACLLMFTVC